MFKFTIFLNYQHLDGIPSLRGTLRRAQTDIAYRWFLGYTLNEELPHFSTVSYNFRHRFTEETIERVFQWVLNEAGTAGALSPAAVFIDGTHIKASANLNKKIKQEVPAAAKRYRDELLAEINADREAHGKKPFDDDDDPPKPAGKKRDNTSKKKLARRKKAGFKTVTKSTTDPDCGMFVKGKHERQFAYEAHTACDKNGYVLETVVTPGNVHDSVAFDDVYDKVTAQVPCGTLRTNFWVAAIFPVTVPVGGTVCQGLVFRADHAVIVFIINILPPLVPAFHRHRTLAGSG